MPQARQTTESGLEQEYRQPEQGQSGQGGRYATYGQARGPTINIAAIALRGIGEAYDMQMAAARLAFQTQARAAVAFGWPDFSDLFRMGDAQSKRIFSKSTEQLLASAQQANATLSELQREVGKLIECNAETMAESWQQGLEEISIQAEESLEQMKELTRQQVEEAMRAAESLSEATRQAMRESSEKFRETVRQGAERGQEAMSEGGEMAREQGETVQEEAQEKTSRRGGRAA
jgi:hypothetical protein